MSPGAFHLGITGAMHVGARHSNHAALLRIRAGLKLKELAETSHGH